MRLKSIRILRYLCIVCVLCSLSSCSFIKTIYQNAPEIVAWWLDDYFDFTANQQAILKPALTRVHQWHRSQQLAGDIATLTTIQLALSEDRVSAAEVCAHIDTIKSRLNHLQAAFTPVISELAPLISDKQLAYLKQKLNKRAEKWKSEWWQETPTEQIEARLDKTVDFAEKVYGHLSAGQRELIKQKLTANPTKPSIIYTEILRRNQDIFQIITALRSNELTPSKKQVMIEAGFARLQASPNLEYQTHADQITQRTCELVSELHASTSAIQKKHATTWIADLSNQLLSL